MRSNESAAPPKASTLIADQLRRRIARGEFGEGDALPNESQLMDRYEVSRPTVRGALRILESESLISVKAGVGGGPRVQLPDVRVVARQVALHLQLEKTTLKDLFDARSQLEPWSVRRLAETRPKKAIALLREMHEQEILLLDDPVAYPEVATRFHEQVIELAGNQTLALIGRLLHEMVEAQNKATFARADTKGRTHAAKEGSGAHAEVIELIAKGLADQAEAHWRSHMADAARVALRSLGAKTVIDLFDEA